jgi:hypothetical protein
MYLSGEYSKVTDEWCQSNNLHFRVVSLWSVFLSMILLAEEVIYECCLYIIVLSIHEAVFSFIGKEVMNRYSDTVISKLSCCQSLRPYFLTG